MFKGSPISPISRSQNPRTIDRIGTPLSSTKTPIADRYVHQPQATISPESPGWLRKVSDRDSLLSQGRKLKYENLTPRRLFNPLPFLLIQRPSHLRSLHLLVNPPQPLSLSRITENSSPTSHTVRKKTCTTHLPKTRRRTKKKGSLRLSK